MTYRQGFDGLLQEWADVGEERLPNRYLQAALREIEHTPQRGAWRAPLEGLLMKLKPAAPIFGVAGVAVVAIAAYMAFSGGNVGGPPTATPEPSAAVSLADLPNIVVADDAAPQGLGHDGTYGGESILNRPIISVEGVESIPYLEQPGFVGGRYSEFSDAEAGLLSWAALFETVEDAERSRALYVDEIELAEGYGMDPGVAAGLGDEGTYYDDGFTRIFLWRAGNLVLAAATYGDFDPEALREVAEGMDARAR